MNERVPTSEEIEKLFAPPKLMFYFAYTIAAGGEVIEHEIECDLNAPSTLVISLAKEEGTYFVSIIVGGDDKREWFAYRIAYLKFGFTK